MQHPRRFGLRPGSRGGARRRARGGCDGQGLILFPYHCLLVRSRGRYALIDCGQGRYSSRWPGSGGRLPEGLAAEGLSAEDIGLVLISHCHVDHIGGLVDGGRPCFPKARHLLSRAEWEFCRAGPKGLSEATQAAVGEQLVALHELGLLELVDGERELLPGVSVVAAPGHTPGHIAVEIGDEALFVGDALLHPLHAEHPEWSMVTDADASLAAETRRRLLARAATEGRVVLGFHLWEPAVVDQAGATFRLRPVS